MVLVIVAGSVSGVSFVTGYVRMALLFCHAVLVHKASLFGRDRLATNDTDSRLGLAEEHRLPLSVSLTLVRADA
jgi:hypothetical protein